MMARHVLAAYERALAALEERGVDPDEVRLLTTSGRPARIPRARRRAIEKREPNRLASQMGKRTIYEGEPCRGPGPAGGLTREDFRRAGYPEREIRRIWRGG
ncbi:MAG: hypothetical protein JRD89_01260 [Deltaproteobacteria bacterium]|nr:hypothetical protein [Deltaproteobacteria bacterium]